MNASLRVNGKSYDVEADPGTSLLEVLREDIGLTGTKYGCGQGQCGACTVIVDGDHVKSCLTPFSEVKDAAITTIEGQATAGRLHAVQQAFLDEGAMQCGYCVAGMINAAISLLSVNPSPSEIEIKDGLNGNICRCGAYPRMVAAVKRAATALRGQK